MDITEVKALSRLEDGLFCFAWDQMPESERQQVRAFAAREYVRVEDESPLDLAMRLDPAIVPTPALRILSREMVLIRDAMEVMYERRALHAALVRSGVDDKKAIERAGKEIESRGSRRSIFTMAPQEGKSTLVTIYGSLWLYRQFPQMKETLVSYDGPNAEQFSYAIRAMIELFDGISDDIDLGLRLAPNQKAVSRWRLQSGGTMYAIGIGGGLTGKPSDYGAIDDPTKDQRDADSELISRLNWEWWPTTMRPRLAPWAPVTLTMTRWHELDLGGRFQIQQAEDESMGRTEYDEWRVVVIPAQADHRPELGEVDVLDREPGEWMVSARGRTIEEWETTKNSTPPRFWNALYQGRPTAASGDVYLEEWWLRYDDSIVVLQPDGSFRVPGWDLSQSWDLTFDDTKGSDYVAGELWGKRGVQSRLITVVHDRMSFPETIDRMKWLRRMFPETRRTLVEKKANGAAALATLRKDIPGLIGINPKESKRERAEAGSIFVRAGNIELPTEIVATLHQSLSFDVKGFIAEHTAFDNGAHDDRVDATSQYIKATYIEGGTGRLVSPVGRQPRASVPRGEQPKTLSPMQRRIAASKENPK